MITLAFLVSVFLPAIVSAYLALGFLGADFLIRRGYCGAELMTMHTYTYTDPQRGLTDQEVEEWITSLDIDSH
jgi:hypothetical protein